MTGQQSPQVRERPESFSKVDGGGLDSTRPRPCGQPESPGTRASERWRSVLGGMGPREILARLLQDDPLDVRRVVAERLGARALLFDADRVHLRALAHCAREAVRYRGTPPLATWLAGIVDRALTDLLREDVQAERRGATQDEGESTALVDLARPLGLDPATMRRVCLAHNLLPDAERRAFHALVIAGRPLEDVARTSDTTGVEIARRARRGLEAVLIAAGHHPRPAEDAGCDAYAADSAGDVRAPAEDADAGVHETSPELAPEDSPLHDPDRAR